MMAEQFHQRIWEILEELDCEYFQVVAAPAPDEETVAAINTLAGFPVPEAYAAFCQRTNGLCVMAREEFWPEAQVYSVGPAWTFWRGVVLLGMDTEELPEWARITSVYQQLMGYEVTDVIPLMKIIGDGNVVWGIDETGTMVEVSAGEVTPLPEDFAGCYAEQIRELAVRQKDMMKLIADRNTSAETE